MEDFDSVTSASMAKKQKSGKATVINIDTLFERLTLWHWSIASFAFIRGIPSTLNIMLLVFIAPKQKFWCAQNGISLFNTTSEFDQWDQCMTLNGTKCTEFIYDRSVYHGRTLNEEWDLVCDKQWLVSTTQSIFLFGNMIGTILFAHIADWFGRKMSLIISLVWSLTGGLAIAFAPNILWYNIFRFITAVGTSGYSDGAYTIVVETSSPKQRYLATLTVGMGWSFGMILFPAWAYFVQDWDLLHIIVPMPIILLIIIWFFLPESPRWQISCGRYEDAKKTLMTLIKHQPRFTEKDVVFIVEQARNRNSAGELKTKATIADLFTKKYRKCSCIFMLLQMLGAMMWYHVTVSTATVGANPYLGFATGAIFEIPAKALNVLFIRFVRRRVTIMTSFFLMTIALSTVAALPKHLAGAKLALLVFCKIWSQVQGATQRVQMSEIYPTIVRSVAVGFMVTMANGGQMIAPFLQNLADATQPYVPFVVLAVLAFLNCGFQSQLQETFEQELPDVLHKKVKRPKTVPYTISASTLASEDSQNSVS